MQQMPSGKPPATFHLRPCCGDEYDLLGRTASSAASFTIVSVGSQYRWQWSRVHSSKLTIRVAFMGKRGMQAADALSMALARTGFVQLGSSRWQVTDNRCSGCVWGSISTWADLTEPCSANWLEFNFATPTAITKSDGRGNRFVSVLPESQDVFGSLMERWKGLEGPSMPSDLAGYIQSGGCRVSDVTFAVLRHSFKNAYKRVSSGRSRMS